MDVFFIGLVIFGLGLLAVAPLINERAEKTSLRGAERSARESVKKAAELGLIPHYLRGQKAYKLVTGEEMSSVFYEAFRRIAMERKPRAGYGEISALIDDERLMTRADCAVIVVKVANQFGIELLGIAGAFDDHYGHPAEEFISCVSHVGIMTAVEGGRFDPNRGLSLQDLVVAAERLTSYALRKFAEEDLSERFL